MGKSCHINREFFFSLSGYYAVINVSKLPMMILRTPDSDRFSCMAIERMLSPSKWRSRQITPRIRLRNSTGGRSSKLFSGVSGFINTAPLWARCIENGLVIIFVSASRRLGIVRFSVSQRYACSLVRFISISRHSLLTITLFIQYGIRSFDWGLVWFICVMISWVLSD